MFIDKLFIILSSCCPVSYNLILYQNSNLTLRTGRFHDIDYIQLKKKKNHLLLKK